MGLFIDVFTLFPRSLFGLAVTDLDFWLEVPVFAPAHINCTSNYHKYNGGQQSNTYELNHINLIFHEGWADLLAPNFLLGTLTRHLSLSNQGSTIESSLCK
jgi:hypothetical protein